LIKLLGAPEVEYAIGTVEAKEWGEKVRRRLEAFMSDQSETRTVGKVQRQHSIVTINKKKTSNRLTSLVSQRTLDVSERTEIFKSLDSCSDPFAASSSDFATGAGSKTNTAQTGWL